jgi:predicted dehydrogenase
VVATPTDTHLDLVSEVLERTRADVLSEKPVSRDWEAVQRFCERHADNLRRIRTVNHFAFSPEVVWASQVISRKRWGPPGRILSCFNDPYATRALHERRTYVSSWVDSGANQLALIARFAEGWALTGHDEAADGMRSVTSVDFDGGKALLSTNWWTGASSKQTVLRWTGDREVVLDHTCMTGVVLDDGRIREHFGNEGKVDRKTAHYAAMYRALFDDYEIDLLGLPLAVRISELLSQAGSRGTPGAGVSWSMAGRG